MAVYDDGEVSWKSIREETNAAEGEEDSERSVKFANYYGKSGVYFISPYYNDRMSENDRVYVKIGMSAISRDELQIKNKQSGLGPRLDSYLLCYPIGFYVYAVLTTPAAYAYSVEKMFHEYFTGKQRKADFEHSHREEWYLLSRRDVFTSIAGYIQLPLR